MRHSWHGIGVHDFLAEIDSWRERYRSAKIEKPHHSEELTYFDGCADGFLILTARQRIGDVSFLRMAELEIRLPGIPVDLEPFKELCQAIGDSYAVFHTLRTTGYEEMEFHPRIPLERIAEIRSKDEVCGLVAKNPFYMNRTKIPRTKDKYSVFSMLSATELLLCSMSDWHIPGDVMDRYDLWRIEGTWTGNLPAFHPICTWNECIREAEDGENKIL